MCVGSKGEPAPVNTERLCGKHGGTYYLYVGGDGVKIPGVSSPCSHSETRCVGLPASLPFSDDGGAGGDDHGLKMTAGSCGRWMPISEKLLIPYARPFRSAIRSDSPNNHPSWSTIPMIVRVEGWQMRCAVLASRDRISVRSRRACREGFGTFDREMYIGKTTGADGADIARSLRSRVYCGV